jgi:gamma-glutamyltranspeptidase / glutathione hydrolase
MRTPGWRERAATVFSCEKRPATSSRGMVVTNHALASAAGARILAEGGNAVDATVAALFALTVVEPMMVGVLGGGMAHIRLPDGSHTVIDGLSTAPLAGRPDMYKPISDQLPNYLETENRANQVGALAVAAPGNLAGWCAALERYGSFPLGDVLAPAIHLAAEGFRVTPYLSTCVGDAAEDLAKDNDLARRFLPDGAPLQPGTRLVQGAYAETLRLIAQHGPDVLYHGPLGQEFTACMHARGGILTHADLATYKVIERAVIRGSYRNFEIVGPPPPSCSGVHVVQMLNILEAYDIRGMGFGSPDALHLLAEVLKIAFADRAAATADPDFINVPVDRLIAKSYAEERRAHLSLDRAQSWGAGVAAAESPNTTHLTVADSKGMVVASTQTINSTFGARVAVPGTGMIANNYMFNFDPHPDKALSVAPGKRVTTSTAPVMALRDGRMRYALGLPGGLRIFGSAMQTLVNLIDHGMSLQESVEAPRLWTQGGTVEVEDAFPEPVLRNLRERGHDITISPHIAGGMNAISFEPDGSMIGAACWRADGTPIALGGGLANRRARFWPDQRRG